MAGAGAVERAAWRLSGSVLDLTRRRVDLPRCLFIQGSPRSGTTWLMEIVTAALDRLPISEPFDPAKMIDLQEPLQLSRRPYRAVGALDPALDQVLGRLFQGRLLRRGFIARRTVTPRRAAGFVAGQPTVIKAVRTAFLLPYICDRFPSLKTVLLVRNPFSVVSSQLGYPMRALGPEVLEPVLRDWPQLRPAHEPGTEVERLAVQWCIEHAYLEAHRDVLGQTLILRYEDLVSDPAADLRRILDHLGERWNPKVLGVLGPAQRPDGVGLVVLVGRPADRIQAPPRRRADRCHRRRARRLRPPVRPPLTTLPGERVDNDPVGRRARSPAAAMTTATRVRRRDRSSSLRGWAPTAGSRLVTRRPT